MKPFRVGAIARSCTRLACLATLSLGHSLAADIFWDATVNPGNWSDAANWSQTNAAGGADPGAAPGAGDNAIFGVTGIATAQVVNLTADQAVGSITTLNQAALTTIQGSGGTRLLTMSGGINHTWGGLTIGSATAGQEVNIGLAGSQTWLSSAANGAPLQAIVIQNNVSIASGGNQTLTLSGLNSGSAINGSITDGAGVLSLVKTGTANSVWTLNSTTNGYTGTTSVLAGTLRFSGGLGTVNASTITVANGATLGARNLTSAQLDAMLPGFATGSTVEIDTATTLTYASNMTGGYNVTKIGSSELLLTGTNTYTGNTLVSAGRLTLSTTANMAGFATAGKTSVASGAVLSLRVGGAGFTNANVNQAVANTSFASGGILGLDTTNGEFIWSGGNLLGTGNGARLNKYGDATLLVTGTNGYTGITTITAGTLAVDSLGAIGSGQISIGSGTVGARFRYTGTGATTSRVFRMDGTTGGAVIESSGSGALVISNAITGTTGTNQSKTLTLTGSNTGGNAINGAITNYGTGTSATSILKTGYGTWTLGGTNAYTGTTSINGGTLIADYSAAGNTADPFAATAITSQTGTLVIRGRTTGATTDTLTSLQVGNGNFGSNIVRLDSNGGAGVNLTVSTLNGSGATQHNDLIDLSSNAANSITVTALATNLGAVNGVLMNNIATSVDNGRASLIVRDTAGYGFATLSGPTSGTLQKLSTFTDVAPSASASINSGTGNFRLTTGSYTTAASAAFSTLTFDSSGGVIDFALGGTHTLAAGTSGKAALFTGSNNVNISGGATAGINTGSALWYHNYLDSAAQLNLSANIGNSQTIMIGGSGFTNYTGTGFGATLVLNGGLFRSAGTQTIAAASSFRVTDTVWEIGADLNGATAGDFSVASGGIGTTSVISLLGSSGFSAYSADPVATPTRVVNLGGAAASLTWGSTGFLTNPDGATDGDHALRLSSTRSNATLDFRNAINLNGKVRTVDVSNGSATVDAVLGGAISGGISSGFVKTGAGTLRLDGANTYTGGTRVDAGTLILLGDINSSAFLEMHNSTVELGASQRIGDLVSLSMENARLHTLGNDEAVGTLAIAGVNTIDLGAGSGSVLTFANSSALTWTGTLSILNWSGLAEGSGGDQILFGTGTTGLTSAQLAAITFVNPDNYAPGSYQATILASGEIVALIPEPSTTLLATAAAAGLLLRRRRQNA